MKKIGKLLIVALLAMTTSAAMADVFYVDGDITAGNLDGSSWENAYKDLQPAIDTAATSAEGPHEVWVKAGTYYPTRNWGSAQRTLSFQLENGVSVYGGFAGYETSVDERDIAGNPTILSGDVGAPGVNADNCYHVFYHPGGTGLDSTAVLDGMQITGGNADLYYGYGEGGGMYNYESSPSVRNCTFSGNSAVNGGGMYNYYFPPSVRNCTFSGNSAVNGGGMYNSQCTALVANCTFYGNNADHGGGVYNNQSSPSVANCTFSSNNADSDGGGMYNYYSSPILTNSIFWGNGTEIVGSEPAITYCVVQGYPGGVDAAGNTGDDPNLGDLADNGGPTMTMAVSGVSSAIDAGDPNSGLTQDQRGVLRPQGGGVDIGAYEYVGVTVDFVTQTIPTNEQGGSLIGDTTQMLAWPASSTSPVTATPASGFRFENWTSDGDVLSNALEITIDNVTADMTITANFVKTLTITSDAGQGGTITPTGETTYDFGADSDYQVTPDIGYHIVDVIVDGDSVGAVSYYQFADITEDHTISAVFAHDEPEIRISGNGLEIANGDMIPSTDDLTNFGAVTLDTGQVSHVFEIRNLGLGILEVNDLFISGPDASDFTITQLPASIIPPSGVTTLDVEFTPTAIGLRQATITVISDDPDEGSYSFAIEGSGIGLPNIVVTGNADFGSAEVLTESIRRDFTIMNTGQEMLVLDFIAITGEHAEDYDVVSAPMGTSLAPGDSAQLSVRFSPQAVGTRTASLNIESNDPDEPLTVLTLTGIGTAPVEIPIALAESLTPSPLTGDVVQLTGVDSYVPGGYSVPLTYSWICLDSPMDPNPDLAGADSMEPTFVPTVAGRYVFRLMLDNGTVVDHTNIKVDVEPAAVNDPIFALNWVSDGNEDGIPAQMLISRVGGDENATATVAYVLSGSAEMGIDYEIAGTTQTFAAGEMEKLVVFTVLADAAIEGPEIIVATLQPDTGYEIDVSADVVTMLIEEDYNASPVIESPATASPQTILVSETTSLSVMASDQDGDALTYTWYKVSGSGTVTFTQINSDFTEATFSAADDYTLQVTISDGTDSVDSQVIVTVEPVAAEFPEEGKWYFIENALNPISTLARLKYDASKIPVVVEITDDSDDCRWKFTKDTDSGAWFIQNANGDKLQDGNGDNNPKLVDGNIDNTDPLWNNTLWDVEEILATGEYFITSRGANAQPRLRTDDSAIPDMCPNTFVGTKPRWEIVETTAPAAATPAPMLRLDASVAGVSGTTWADQSGNAQDATTILGTVSYPSASLSASGKSGVDFGPDRNMMELFSAADSDSWLDQSAGTGGFCVMVAFKCDALHTNWSDLIGNTSTVSAGFGMRFGNTGVMQAYLKNTINSTSTVVAGDTVVYGFNYDAATGAYEFWDSKSQTAVTGTQLAADFSTGAPMTLGSTTGATRFFKGMVGEVRVYDRVLTPTEFTATQTEMVDTWGTSTP